MVSRQWVLRMIIMDIYVKVTVKHPSLLVTLCSAYSIITTSLTRPSADWWDKGQLPSKWSQLILLCIFPVILRFLEAKSFLYFFYKHYFCIDVRGKRETCLKYDILKWRRLQQLIILIDPQLWINCFHSSISSISRVFKSTNMFNNHLTHVKSRKLINSVLNDNKVPAMDHLKYFLLVKYFHGEPEDNDNVLAPRHDHPQRLWCVGVIRLVFILHTQMY